MIQDGGQKIITRDYVDKKIIGHLTDLSKKKYVLRIHFFKFPGFGGNFVSKQLVQDNIILFQKKLAILEKKIITREYVYKKIKNPKWYSLSKT